MSMAASRSILRLLLTLGAKVGAQTVFNPPITEYPVNYAPTPVEAAIHDKIMSEQLVAWRLPTENGFSWTGAMT